MKIAVTTIAWGKIRSKKAFINVLKSIKDIGYDGVGIETRLLPKELLSNPKELSDILSSINIENAGAYSRMDINDIRWAVESKTSVLWVVPRFKDCNEALLKLEDFTKTAIANNVIPALHNHLRTCFETEEQVAKALDKISELYLCLDTAHAKAAGIDVVDFIERYHDRISLVHIKDLRAQIPKSKVRFKRDFVNVGKGIINFREIIDALHRSGYRGYLMLEIEALSNVCLVAKNPFEINYFLRSLSI
ncbi:sugar phosphate isomerase/epimerase [Desulfurella sp.]|uniref:sugar phosphate isomerase/epimerase family protein n=1 Tax=Desulfurella sp. TaxID=1962857 RepID=UPI0025BCAF74|nr:sugar phosphate isomerase/epimerase [Desulfurella sp.]